MATKTVRYVFEEAVSEVAEVHVTVGTVNLLQLGEHAKLRRIYQFHVDSLAGKPIADMTQEEYAKVEPDLLAFSSIWSRWAGVKVSIRGIKVRVAGAAEGDLMDADLGLLGWDTVDGIKSIPVDLFEALDTASVTVNPRVFGRFVEEGGDPKERTTGVISVS